MIKHYFTFGGGMHDTHGRSLANYYVEVEGDYNTARAKMFDEFGPKWGFQYDEAGFAGQPEKYGLQPLNLEGVELCCGIEQKEAIKAVDEIARLKMLLDTNGIDWTDNMKGEAIS